MSFYRSQNVLGWSKFFGPDQKFIHILWQSQTFRGRQKADSRSVKFVFVQAQKFLDWLKISRPAQKILVPVRGQGIRLFFSEYYVRAGWDILC